MRFCMKIPSLAGAKQHFLLFFVHREAVTMKALNSYGYITNFQTDIPQPNQNVQYQESNQE